MAPSVRIWFTDLAAMKGNTRLPLADVSVGSHVHGRLHFEVLGRQLGPFAIAGGQLFQFIDLPGQSFTSISCSDGRACSHVSSNDWATA